MQFDYKHLTHIDSVGSLGDPAILVATVISSALLVFLTIKMFLLWLRLKGTHDVLARSLLIVLFCGTYFGTAFFQYWLATVLYREFHDIGDAVTLGLSVPIVPVLLMGVISGVIFVVLRVSRKLTLR
jgi:hypothetical protein